MYKINISPRTRYVLSEASCYSVAGMRTEVAMRTVAKPGLADVNITADHNRQQPKQ
jgi:hypothetical protein